MKHGLRKALTALAAILMAGITAMSVMGCFSSPDQKFDDAQSLLLYVWNKVPMDERPSVFGGVGGDQLEGEPAPLDLSNQEMICSALVVPAELVTSSKSGSSLINAMMANSLTISAWQLKSQENEDVLIANMEKTLQDNQWLCELPEEYTILKYDDFLVVVFGLKSQTEPFVKTMRKELPASVDAASMPLE